MKMTRHMSANIAGMISLYKKKSMKGLIEDENGKPMGDAEARAYLNNCLAEGKRVIPCGNCEGFDYQTGCPGHPQPENNEQP